MIQGSARETDKHGGMQFMRRRVPGSVAAMTKYSLDSYDDHGGVTK
ncbi:MAG TPA: hypothetical protein VND22_02165 [Actinomycetota bacterium]|nr:hypothetical protein [Actinomycetota bacterium]